MIIPRTREASPRHAFAQIAALSAAMAGGVPIDLLGETKTAGGYEWANAACAQANRAQGSGCLPSGGVAGDCPTVTLGYPQGAAAGVVATTAQGTFVLPCPARLVPYQLILSGTAQGFQVLNFTAGLNGPLLAGTATSPLGGDLFGPNVQEPVPLKAVWVDAGVSLTLILLNPTLNNLTFVGSLKVVLG